MTVAPAAAQITGADPFGKARFDTVPSELIESELPEIRLRLARTVELPGPLPLEPILDATPEGARVEYADATWIVPWTDEPPRREGVVAEAPAGFSGETWSLRPDGRYRFRPDEAGRLIAQKCCGVWNRRWHRAWRLRLPGRVSGFPLAFEKLVAVAATDNKLYGIRSRNGHRVWSVDVGERVTRPLGAWSGPLPAPETRQGSVRAELVVVVPDAGDRIWALDAASGRKAAEFPIVGDGDRLVGRPTVSDQGEIVMLLQRYDLSRAALLVFVIETVQADETSPSGSTESSG